MSKLLWMIGQAAAICGLTYCQARDPLIGSEQVAGLLLVNIVVVAFATALAVNLWDWLFRRGRPHDVGEPQGRSRGTRRVGRQTCELPQEPFRRRIGEDTR